MRLVDAAVLKAIRDAGAAGISFTDLRARASKKRGQPSKALRQPVERPEHVTLTPEDRAPSWWVGLSREELRTAMAARSEEMRNSKSGRLLSLKMLQ